MRIEQNQRLNCDLFNYLSKGTVIKFKDKFSNSK